MLRGGLVLSVFWARFARLDRYADLQQAQN
jgi:hypothetical protein